MLDKITSVSTVEETHYNTLISIIMPTYNVRPYICEAVESILQQTYSHFELIIVDDCSTDGTYELLQEFEKKDQRVKLYRNSSNLKICKTLNKAFSHAKGSFIGRMDGDDISEPTRFELLKKHLDEHPEIALVGSNLVSIDENGKKFGKKRYPQQSRTIKYGNRFYSSVPHFWLARREVYDVLNGYREIPYSEDYDFLLRGETQGYKYSNIPEYAYCCRIRLGNTVFSNGIQQKKAVEFVQNLHRKEKKKNGDFFKAEDYERAIYSTQKEIESYAEAARLLNDAIQNKGRKIKMLVYVGKAFYGNKYMRKYLISAFRFRLIIKWEDILLAWKKNKV